MIVGSVQSSIEEQNGSTSKQLVLSVLQVDDGIKIKFEIGEVEVIIPKEQVDQFLQHINQIELIKERLG